jgi:hypothetical protein
MEREMHPAWNLIAGFTAQQINTESGIHTAPKPGGNTNMEVGL